MIWFQEFLDVFGTQTVRFKGSARFVWGYHHQGELWTMEPLELGDLVELTKAEPFCNEYEVIAVMEEPNRFPGKTIYRHALRARLWSMEMHMNILDTIDAWNFESDGKCTDKTLRAKLGLPEVVVTGGKRSKLPNAEEREYEQELADLLRAKCVEFDQTTGYVLTHKLRRRA
jgi:hypothetical protein